MATEKIDVGQYKVTTDDDGATITTVDLSNGVTVRLGHKWRFESDSPQLGIPAGVVIEVEAMMIAPDGLHIKFSPDFSDTDPLPDYNEDAEDVIYGFAFENLVEDSHLALTEESQRYS